MSTNQDIVIIGGGAMGLATATQLADTEHQVLVLETYTPIVSDGWKTRYVSPNT